MNKAFELILKNIEEKRNKYQRLADGSNFDGWNEEDIKYSAKAEMCEKLKEIVQEVAEEYKDGWIPCSERLPEERDWYLAVFEEVDTGFIGLPYIADYLMGKHNIATTEDGWIIRNCTDREDESAEYYKNLRCVAWQPLPEPYKERD